MKCKCDCGIYYASMIKLQKKTSTFAVVFKNEYRRMAKVGYIYRTSHDDSLAEDRVWMADYGCVQIVEEETAQEKLRPQWKRLLASLDRGDELVVAKFSNAVQGLRELSTLLEFCRVKVVRLISIRDRIDTGDKLFPDTTTSQIMQMFGALPEEVMVLRRAEAHVQYLQQHIKPTRFKTLTAKEKSERENMIVSMYNNGHTLDDIYSMSGFKSRSSIFRILNKYGVKLNRGNFSGPLGKRKPKDTDTKENDNNNEKQD